MGGSRFLALVLIGFTIGVVYGEGRVTIAAGAGVLLVAACLVMGKIAERRLVPELERLAREM